MKLTRISRQASIACSLAVLILASACSAATPANAPAGANQPTAAPAGQKELLDIVKERGVLRVSTDANYAPQSYFDEKTKEWTGFDIDTAREVAKRLGVQVEFITPQWDAVTSGNWAGRWDVSIGSMTITAERQKVLDFTPPYYYSLAQFGIRADLKDTIKTIEDLSGKTVCVAKATTYEDYLNGKLVLDTISTAAPKDVKVAPVETDQLCIQTIQSGRKEYDAVLTAANVVNDGIQKGAPIAFLGNPVYSEPLAIAIDKSSAPNAKFVEAISKIITEMHTDGTLSKLAMKYYGYDLSVVPK
ncbi:MAG: transporter substrate-binding domain-containing protein [Chloroflexi bacterium]|nr:transporter substrate-binding domain-containing protein [Chloroflexota bacterium]